jgi:hypothetical protein
MGMSDGIEGSLMLMVCVVENVRFPISVVFAYGEGLAWVSALHAGVPCSWGPPALTR